LTQEVQMYPSEHLSLDKFETMHLT